MWCHIEEFEDFDGKFDFDRISIRLLYKTSRPRRSGLRKVYLTGTTWLGLEVLPSVFSRGGRRLPSLSHLQNSQHYWLYMYVTPTWSDKQCGKSAYKLLTKTDAYLFCCSYGNQCFSMMHHRFPKSWFNVISPLFEYVMLYW